MGKLKHSNKLNELSNYSFYKAANKQSEKVTTNNLSKARETRDSLAVPVCTLSWSISSHFVAIHS